MRINKLHTRYFKADIDERVEPLGKDVAIYLRNGGGKSTKFDAFLWVPTGRDSRGQADFEIATIDPSTGLPFPDVDHTVYLELIDGKGHIRSFERSYQTEHKQTRGKLESKAQNTTKYKMDGVPMKEGEFLQEVDRLFERKRFRLLSDPMWFNSDGIKESSYPAWQVRRRILLEICGDVSDQQVILSNEALADLPALLGDRKLDDFKKILTARRTEINALLKNIPSRISEATGLMPQVNFDADQVKEAIETRTEKIKKLNERKAQLSAGGEVAELTIELRTLEGNLQQRTNELNSGQSDPMTEYRSSKSKAESALADARRSLNSLLSDKATLTRAIESLERDRQKLLGDYKIIEANSFKPFSADSICPTCKQEIPESQLEEAKEAYAQQLGDFNESKAQRLSEIRASGLKIKSEKEAKDQELASLQADIDVVETVDVPRAQAALDAIEMPEVNPSNAPAHWDDPDCIRITDAIAELNRKISVARLGNTSAIDRLDMELGEWEGKLKSAQQAELDLKRKEEIQIRINQLQAEERKLAEEFQASEGHLFLIDEFVRTKVSMLTERINSKFDIVQWRLFETQQNGGVNEVCECTVKGVPWSDLSTSERINAGLDCINAMCEAWGQSMPIFIDNCESITKPIHTIGQQIRLIVSPQDETMRVEPIDWGMPTGVHVPVQPAVKTVGKKKAKDEPTALAAAVATSSTPSDGSLPF